jgi:hypothetical protein
MGEVSSLLAAFLTDIGNRRAVSGAEVIAARKSRRGLSVPDPPAVISLPHRLSSAFISLHLESYLVEGDGEFLNRAETTGHRLWDWVLCSGEKK